MAVATIGSIEKLNGSDYVDYQVLNDNLSMVRDYIANTLYPATFYKAGDVVTFNTLATAGFLTNSKTSVWFTIPTSHVISASNVSATGSIRVRQNGVYIVGDADNMKSVTMEASMRGGSSSRGYDCVTVRATVSTSSSAVQNNEVVGIAAVVTLTFS